MLTDEQLIQFIGLQRQIGILTRDYLAMLPEVVEREGLLEKYDGLTRKLDAGIADEREEAQSSLELARMSDFSDCRGNLLRGLRPGIGQSQFFDSLPADERFLLSSILDLEDKVRQIAPNSYEDALGFQESVFLRHDLTHQFGDFGILFKNRSLIRHKEDMDFCAMDEINRGLLKDPDVLLMGLAYYRDEIGFLAASSHGIAPDMEVIDFPSMMKTLSYVLAARGNVFSNSFGVAIPGAARIARNSMSYYVDPIRVIGNPGALYTVGYNYGKNSLKKIFEEIKVGKHPEGARINMSVEDCSRNFYVIFESDSGSPVCIDGFINEVRRRLRSGDSERVTDYLQTVSPRTLDILKRWENYPFAIHDLEIGDAAELIHTGGITGIGQNYTSGSGTGLLSVRYMIEAHGGKVLYTQSYNSGGPIFAALLPKDPLTTRKNSLEEEVRSLKNFRSPHIERLSA